METAAGENVVAAEAGGLQIACPEVHAHAFGGAIGQMEGPMEPPVSVVVPEMVVGSRGLLTAGNDGRCDLIHGDVVVWIHDIAMPGKTERPS